MTSCIVKLAETEVMAFEPTANNRENDFSGKWHNRLGNYGHEMALPGVQGIVLLQKGELGFKQGHHNEAEEYSQRVIEMSDLPRLAYFKDKALQVQKQLALRKS